MKEDDNDEDDNHTKSVFGSIQLHVGNYFC